MVDDSDKIKQLDQKTKDHDVSITDLDNRRKAVASIQSFIDEMQGERTNMANLLNDVITARAATNADLTVPATLKDEVRKEQLVIARLLIQEAHIIQVFSSLKTIFANGG